MNKNTTLFMCAALCVLVFSSCTKEPLDNLSPEESRIYITHHDSTVNFGSYSTYSINDSVAVIDNNRLAQKATTQLDLAYINAVKGQMQQRGYKLVAKNQNPDLGVNVSRVYNTYTGIVSYPDYYGLYAGYWDPFYWGYPGYAYYFPVPYYIGIYQITEGALSIDILDLKNAKSGNKISGIWNGLVRGSGVFNGDPGLEVQILFNQSPYLKATR